MTGMRPWCSRRILRVCNGLADHDLPDGPLCDPCYRHHPKPQSRRWDNAPGGRGVPRAQRLRILQRDGYQCQLRYPGCAGHADEVDHVKNMASYGGADRANADHPANDGLAPSGRRLGVLDRGEHAFYFAR